MTDHRYLVLPDRPSEADDWTADELRALVTRDSLIGVTVPTITVEATVRENSTTLTSSRCSA
jgi:Nitrile hydratase, alpha chain